MNTTMSSSKERDSKNKANINQKAKNLLPVSQLSKT